MNIPDTFRKTGLFFFVVLLATLNLTVLSTKEKTNWNVVSSKRAAKYEGQRDIAGGETSRSGKSSEEAWKKYDSEVKAWTNRTEGRKVETKVTGGETLKIGAGGELWKIRDSGRKLKAETKERGKLTTDTTRGNKLSTERDGGNWFLFIKILKKLYRKMKRGANNAVKKLANFLRLRHKCSSDIGQSLQNGGDALDVHVKKIASDVRSADPRPAHLLSFSDPNSSQLSSVPGPEHSSYNYEQTQLLPYFDLSQLSNIASPVHSLQSPFNPDSPLFQAPSLLHSGYYNRMIPPTDDETTTYKSERISQFPPSFPPPSYEETIANPSKYLILNPNYAVPTQGHLDSFSTLTGNSGYRTTNDYVEPSAPPLIDEDRQTRLYPVISQQENAGYKTTNDYVVPSAPLLIDEDRQTRVYPVTPQQENAETNQHDYARDAYPTSFPHGRNTETKHHRLSRGVFGNYAHLNSLNFRHNNLMDDDVRGQLSAPNDNGVIDNYLQSHRCTSKRLS